MTHYVIRVRANYCPEAGWYPLKKVFYNFDDALKELKKWEKQAPDYTFVVLPEEVEL